MARPLKNKSNFLDEQSKQILWAAANRVATPDYTALSLVSVGWLKVVRYGGEHKYMYLHCCREMYNHIARMRILQKRQSTFLKCDNGDYNSTLFWVNYLDGLTDTEKATLILYYKGKNTMDSVGKKLGVTKEAIRCRLNLIYEKFRSKSQRRKRNK